MAAPITSHWPRYEPVCARPRQHASSGPSGRVIRLRRGVVSGGCPPQLHRSGDQWQSSDPDAVGLDYDDACILESAGELRQVGSKQLCLIARAVLAAVSEQDHRRRGLLACRQGACRSRCRQRPRHGHPWRLARRCLRLRRRACPSRGRGRHRARRGSARPRPPARAHYRSGISPDERQLALADVLDRMVERFLHIGERGSFVLM